MTDLEKRLLRENADLKARVSALEVLLAPTKPAPPPEPQVRISSPPLAKMAMPTDDEFRRLLHVVLDRYPVLKPREDPEDYAAQFRAAFIRLQHCGRRDKVDTERGLGWWLDDGAQWCRRHNVNPPWIGGAAFTAAVIAHGDIRFVMDDWPHDFSVALQWGGGGYECKDWWRRALSGTLLDPTPSSYPQAAASPARVQAEVGYRRS
jgi:hypothetical protein